MEPLSVKFEIQRCPAGLCSLPLGCLSSIHNYPTNMSFDSLIRSVPVMGEKELCKGLLAQRLFGSVTEDHLLMVAARAIDWRSLSNRERTARLSAFIRQGPYMPGFRTAVWEQLGDELYQLIWKPAADLASLPLEFRGSGMWDRLLDSADAHERQHDIHRAKAAWLAPLLAEGPNMYAIDYLTLNWHCDACGAIAMSQLPPDRNAFILDQVKTTHSIMEEDYMERQEARCRDGY